MKLLSLALVFFATAPAFAGARAERVVCDLELTTPNVRTYSGRDLHVTPFSPRGEVLGVFASPSGTMVGQLELQVSLRREHGAWAPVGQITSYPNYLERFPTALPFVREGEGWTAEFRDLQRGDRVVIPEQIPLSGVVRCRAAVTLPFVFAARSVYVKPNSFVPGDGQRLGSSLDSTLGADVYCIYGDSRAAFAALRESPDFSKSSRLELRDDGSITYTLDRFVCDEEVDNGDGSRNCVSGHAIEDSIAVVVPVCR